MAETAIYSTATSAAESEIDDTLRQATSSRSPLAELISDPVLLRSLTRQRPDKSLSSSRRDEGRRRDRDHDSDTASRILSVVLAEEEREVQHLKTQLIVLGEQLKGSMRRAADAEQRAHTAQSREREALAKAERAEQTKHRAELEVARQQEEMKRYRQQIETLERQVGKSEYDIRILQRKKDRAEEAASDAKDALRQYKQSTQDMKAREEGIEEGRRLGLRRGFSSGRLNGWKVGQQDGFQEGIAYGRQESRIGVEDEDRQTDEGQDGDNLKRTRSWAESLGQETDEVFAVEASSMQSSSSMGEGSPRMYTE
ncbi:hypothetical protein EW145_g5907 [Phellinidium pouzarii]|uniref:Essential protein Yae1 N-terminal domain-containing protein n=1 Tax=Phellinidium pouzarii TaxID=167371 RepID=A0A4S4KYD2_9AGAM|nr:hypothetical protein EW145_g5907 [Phellinidium pouzarii]